MKRNYFVSEISPETKLKEVALANTLKGDECTLHYHKHKSRCNKKCHVVEVPKEEAGKVL